MSTPSPPHLVPFLAALCGVAVLAAACSSPPRLQYDALESESLPGSMAYAVWTPRDLRPEERLPLLVFLHGGGDDEECFDDAEVGAALDEALARGRIPRAVIVVPDGELGFWENWYDGSRAYRDWVVQELMPAVQSRFHTRPCPEGCHVAGVSMGGHGALRFALFHPDRFSSAAALSGIILSSDDVEEFADSWLIRLFVPFERIWGPATDRRRVESQDLFLRWRTQEDLEGLRLMVAWADEDGETIIESNRAFREHLVAHDIDHEHLVFPGRHAWTAWTPVLERVLRFAVWGSMDAAGPGDATPTTGARRAAAEP